MGIGGLMRGARASFAAGSERAFSAAQKGESAAFVASEQSAPVAGVRRVDVSPIHRIAAGDVSAVAELYDQHASMLFAIAYRILRDRAEAEDAMHDVFMAVIDRAWQFEPERGSVEAWLVVLTRNLGIDRARRRIRRGELERDVLVFEPTPAVRTPEGLAGDAAAHARMRRALAVLPIAQRETLEAGFFEGLTYGEIAARENLAVGTVKSRAVRGLHSLRDALSADTVERDPPPVARRPTQ